MNEYHLSAMCRGIALLADVRRDAGVTALMRLCCGAGDPAEQYADYWRALAAENRTDDATAYMREAILNAAFTVTDKTRAEFERELDVLYKLSRLTAADFAALKDIAADLPALSCGTARPFSADEILSERQRTGSGIFRKSCAFGWDGAQKRLIPLSTVDPIRLTDLKEYEEERAAVLDNTLCFLEGLPANNVLLYGDRGTGKSSTVKAVLNELKERGLKLIELNKREICDLPLIAQAIRGNLRFILFIDDLAFESRSDDYASLKAALEGSVSKSDNMLIYATTNRRHILKENHSDRLGDDLHAADTMEEQLSLSDRFGLTITFMAPTKPEFLSILSGILADRNVTVDPQKLATMAERWALRKGGRSPRAARQLADILESRIKRGLSTEDL